jgi:adenosylcobinamide-GDP ribazoletransferase
MIRAVLGALQFLTISPVRSSTAAPGKSALFFPLIGAWIGIIGAALFDLSRMYMPTAVAAMLVLTFFALLTGGLHEDGFADCADAFRAGRRRDVILAILKDSRIGAHGALALILSSLLRWQALTTLAVVDPVPSLAAAQGLPRAAAVALVWITPATGSGLGFRLSNSMTTPIAIGAILQGLLLAMWCGDKSALILIAGAVLIVLAARRYFMLRIGGVTGDCLGATAHAVEIFCLVVFTCRSCIS